LARQIAGLIRARSSGIADNFDDDLGSERLARAGRRSELADVSSGSRLLAQLRDHVEDAEHLAAVADHLPVARLSPAKYAVAIHHEGRAVGDIAIGIEHVVRADDLAVNVAQERERQPGRLDERLMTEDAVAADGEERDAPIPE
jgi:hypothetical protein